MIIELLGPSGAGKTTIADALAVRLRQEGYAVQTVIWRRDRLLSRSLAKGVRASSPCLLAPRKRVWHPS
jgi:adenylate kinase family enzyme